MESSSAHYSAQKTPWLLSFFTFPAVANLFDSHVLFPLFLAFLSVALLTWAFAPAGIAWKNGRNSQGRVAIPGLKGVPFFGSLFSLSLGLPHRYLASMAKRRHSTELMAFSVGETPVVVSSHPVISREILTSPHFADRPVKQSARSLMFSRAIGFAPNGAYWRLLRRIASSHLFSPRRISAHEAGRQNDCDVMLRNIANEQKQSGCVSLRKHLQFAALNNVMGSVFGKRYDLERDGNEFEQLREMVREGFDLLGSFNWSDYLPWISFFYDPSRIVERCSKLAPRVQQFVKKIIDEHRHNELKKTSDKGDFVDVLLSLDGDEKLQEDDMIAVLWVHYIVLYNFNLMK